MQKVDRLLAKAKKAVQRNAERFFMGFVEPDPDTGKWTAQGQLVGGRIDGVRQIFTEHDTMEAAVAALHALAAEYPNYEDVPIFIDDITE